MTKNPPQTCMIPKIIWNHCGGQIEVSFVPAKNKVKLYIYKDGKDIQHITFNDYDETFGYASQRLLESCDAVELPHEFQE